MDPELSADIDAMRPEAERLLRELPLATEHWLGVHAGNLAALIVYHRRESALQPQNRPPRAARDELYALANALKKLDRAARGVSPTAWRAVVTELGGNRTQRSEVTDDYGYKRLDSFELFFFNNRGGLGTWLHPRLLPALKNACKRLENESWGKTRRAARIADQLASFFEQVTGRPPGRGRSGPFVRFVQSVLELAEVRSVSVPDLAAEAADRFVEKSRQNSEIFQQ